MSRFSLDVLARPSRCFPRILRPAPFLFATALLIVLTSPSNARAEGHMMVAAEVGADTVVTNVGDEDVDTLGVSAAARLGYTMGGTLLRVTPELKLGFESPGTPNSFSVKGGARVNFLKGISPAIFAHAGGLVGDMEGVVWDIGVGLDLALFPHVDLGVFAAYNQVGNGTLHFTSASYRSSNWEWMQFGGQIAFYF